jgi:hypothetical protein
VCSTAPRGSDEAPTPAASAASSSSVEGFSLNTSRPICVTCDVCEVCWCGREAGGQQLVGKQTAC